MAAVAGFLYGKPIPRRDSLAEAYANVGKVYRLTTEIQALAKQILDTDLVASNVDATGLAASDSTSSDSTSGILDGLIEERKKQAQREHFLFMDTLFQTASPLQNAFFAYHWANLLTRLGREDEAFGQYAQLIDIDYDCDLFRRIYIEKVGAKNGYDTVLKRMKKTSEASGAPLNAQLWVNECYISQGKPDKAISEDTKFLKNNPGHILALSQRARAYQAKGDMAHASEDASAVVAADSTNYDGWYVLGLTAQAGADPMAKEYLAKAVSYAPEGLSIGSKAQEALKALK